MSISIANNLLANTANLNLSRNQDLLSQSVNRLSSGLRINTAADDPSGLAISEALQAQVNGFQQAVQNVQNANDAAQVAEGALQTTTDILQRIRSLAVEASNDTSSPTDKQNLQVEVSQLVQEVNTISGNTNFNGQQLLDGSHAGFQPAVLANDTVTANGYLNQGGQLISGVTIANAGTSTGVVDSTIELQVVTLGTSTNGQALVGLQATEFDSSSNTVVNLGIIAGGAGSTSIAAGSYTVAGAGAQDTGITISYGAINSNDVGTTSFIKATQFVAASSSPVFNFQSGANEGDVVQLGIQATNASTLRIANINLVSGSTTNPSIGAEDAIGQVDFALNSLLAQRAALGATIVRLNEDANNDQITQTNLQASESSIRDVNVGQETTNFTRLQVLVQVGTSVLAQANQIPGTVLKLLP
ncbi:MAG TPA: flagellin [Candidatus Dormibacteraeota bacterium]|nr:flagellin [Candidatus Dormibacteraeota bacterium]